MGLCKELADEILSSASQKGKGKRWFFFSDKKIAHPKVQDAKQAWQEADLAEQELLTELKYDKEVYGWWKWGQTAQEDY